ncbi:stage II sporulation protein M [Candidatus Micrarchaeota archaeon]|nr:stage II sporulation protein M [Candidatus Micrarchaeota archaeon]
MVLDFLVSPSQVRRDPWAMVLATFVFVSFGVLVELFLPIRGSIIVFTMVPLIPVVWRLLLEEEEDEEKEVEEFKNHHVPLTSVLGHLRTHHADMLEVFGFFFLGAALAYTFWFAVLPPEPFQLFGQSVPGSSELFADQLREVDLIQSSVLQGRVTTPMGDVSGDLFLFLFTHNLQVLGLMLVFSLVYGIGSIYLLLWNASIIGVVVGKKMQVIGPLGVVQGFLVLLPHGIFELGAYFLASIAGGLFSMELMKNGLSKPVLFRHVFKVSFVLLGISVLLLVVGAFIEASY